MCRVLHRLDIGVIPEIRHLAGLDYIDLYDEKSELYCGHGHQLFALHNKQLTVPMINRHDAVKPAAMVPLENKNQLAKMHTIATATDREGAAFLILSGQYISFLPTHFAKRWVQAKKMRPLLPKVLNYRTQYAAITRKGARPNLVLQTFLEELNRPERQPA